MGAPHRAQYDLEQEGAFSSTVSIFRSPEGIVFGGGTTVGNGIEGWAPGAPFVDTDSGTISRNDGTTTTATWDVLQLSGSVAIVDTGTYFTTDTLNGSTDEIGADVVAATPKKRIVNPVTNFRNTSGAALGVGLSDTTSGFVPIYTNEVILILAGTVTTAVTATFTLPKDLDSASDVKIFILGGTDDGNAARVITATAYMGSDGAESADIVTSGSTPTWAITTETYASQEKKEVVIAAAGVPDPSSAPVNCTVTLTPDAGAADMYISAVWLEYTGQLKT